jgi:hypothetical protein
LIFFLTESNFLSVKAVVENLNMLQNPGKLFPGKSQDINETTDPGAVFTKAMSDEGLKREKSARYDMIEKAIEDQRKAMTNWGQAPR